MNTKVKTTEHTNLPYWRWPRLSPTCNKVLRWGAVFFVLLSVATLSSSWFLPQAPAIHSSLFKMTLRIGGGVGIGAGLLAGLLLQRSANRAYAHASRETPIAQGGVEVDTSDLLGDRAYRNIWLALDAASQTQGMVKIKLWAVVSYNPDQKSVETIILQAKPLAVSNDPNRRACCVEIVRSKEGKEYLRFIQEDSSLAPSQEDAVLQQDILTLLQKDVLEETSS